MKIFFVDSENVGCQGLRGMTDLSKDDIIYFLTNLAFQECTVPLSFAFALKTSPARFFNVPLNTRRISQYLDRVLGTLLGHALALYPEAEAIIVSRDKGYLPEIEYWQSQGRAVSQFPSIYDCLRSPHTPSTPSEDVEIEEWQDSAPETPQEEEEISFAHEKCDDFKQEQEVTGTVPASEGSPAIEKCNISQKSPAKKKRRYCEYEETQPFRREGRSEVFRSSSYRKTSRNASCTKGGRAGSTEGGQKPVTGKHADSRSHVHRQCKASEKILQGKAQR